MHIDIAVALECCGDRQAGDEGSAEAVDKDIDLLSLVFGKFTVNGRAVEIVASDIAFERVTAIYKLWKRQEMSGKITTLQYDLQRSKESTRFG